MFKPDFLLAGGAAMRKPMWINWHVFTWIIPGHAYHHDVINWKHFPRYWPFVRGIHRSGEFPAQRPVTRSFDVFFDLRLNKRLSKQPWGWWFDTSSWSLWRQCNDTELTRNAWRCRWARRYLSTVLDANTGSSRVPQGIRNLGDRRSGSAGCGWRYRHAVVDQRWKVLQSSKGKLLYRYICTTVGYCHNRVIYVMVLYTPAVQKWEK